MSCLCVCSCALLLLYLICPVASDRHWAHWQSPSRPLDHNSGLCSSKDHIESVEFVSGFSNSGHSVNGQVCLVDSKLCESCQLKYLGVMLWVDFIIFASKSFPPLISIEKPSFWAALTSQKKMWSGSWRKWGRSTKAMPITSCTRTATTSPQHCQRWVRTQAA